VTGIKSLRTVTTGAIRAGQTGAHFGGKVAETLLYGPYFIVFNGSLKQSVEVSCPKEIHGATVRNLQTGKQVQLEPKMTIRPMSSYAFYVPGRVDNQ